jgi:tetratricopeptide (TPR) repeat protein
MKLPKIGLLAIGIALILVAMGCSEGLYEHALEEYDKAIELDSTDAGAYYDRAIGYRYLGEDQLALKDLDKAIELDPKLARAYTDRGITRQGLGQYMEGIQDYDQAIALDPADAKAYYNRSIAYGKLDKNENMKTDKAKACSLDRQYC